MSTLNNPGHFDCLEKLKTKPDMPFFVLLGSDPCAIASIQVWAEAAAANGVPAPKVEEARQCAQAMMQWQRVNGSKVPD